MGCPRLLFLCPWTQGLPLGSEVICAKVPQDQVSVPLPPMGPQPHPGPFSAPEPPLPSHPGSAQGWSPICSLPVPPQITLLSAPTVTSCWVDMGSSCRTLAQSHQEFPAASEQVRGQLSSCSIPATALAHYSPCSPWDGDHFLGVSPCGLLTSWCLLP
jgi:hypothetical protein